MKKLLFLIVLFSGLQANAQNYLISFTGTGASGTVSTVKIENLTKGTFLTLNGSDVLRLTTATSINMILDKQTSGMKIYPNPMTDNSTIEIFPPVAGNAVISILDIAGKQVAQIQSYFENFRQDYILSGIKNGFYLINVKGNGYQLSGKLLSNGKPYGTINIEKVNNNIQAFDEKTEKTDSKGIQATVDMAYSIGDRLKLTGSSGNYSTVITDIPSSDKTITFRFTSCTDGDNNIYSVVAIGNQVWMAENLKTTRYSNGDIIGTTSPATLDIINESAPKYQWAWDGIEGNVTDFGRLYTWYSVSDSRNLCPAGWSVPSQDEWTILTDFLGGLSFSGGRLKEVGTTHWLSPNTGATNETGFTALPGGYRFSNGGFGGRGSDGIWWSLTESNLNVSRTIGMGNSYTDAYGGSNSQRSGYSVRCIKRESDLPAITTSSVSLITGTTATSGGIVTSDGGATVTARGVCWSTSENPTIADNNTTNGSGTGAFTSSITGLTTGTTYYVRAYATNSRGTSYGSQISFNTILSDIDGNVYNSVPIGTQVWMVENLKTTRYNNGDIIGTTIPFNKDISGENTPKYQWAYDGDESNVATFSRLYTWYVITDSRKLCPAGWHIPADAEWTILSDYLIKNGYGYGIGNGSDIGKSMAATYGWKFDATAGHIGNNQASNNTSGFTALPSGNRASDGTFGGINEYCVWGSTTEYAESGNFDVLVRNMFSDAGYLFVDQINKSTGFSVRCVKDY